MKKYTVAVVGATGAVGREMLKIMEERSFPVEDLKVIASEKSAGKKIKFAGNDYTVQTIHDGVFNNVDIALFSIGSELSRKYSPQAVAEGATVIDNSNAFRMDNEVPLVVPEINSEKIAEHNGIIANPNCSTIQMVLVLKPIYDRVGIKRVVVSTYQAVSGTGKKAIDELEQQVRDYTAGKELNSEVYPYQIAFNALPHIDIFLDNGYTREEMKMVNETRKILNDNTLAITATAVRIPVLYGHSEAVNVETKHKISLEETRNLLDNFPGVKVIEDYPVTLMSEKNDDVMVGRIREDCSLDKGLNMWIVANNLRKGAALNAVQIAEKLIQ